MTLEQLEEKMGIEFPKGFHEIYETGAMEWLTVTREEFLKNRSQYLDNPKSYLMLPCMCEPIPFEDISMWNGFNKGVRFMDKQDMLLGYYICKYGKCPQFLKGISDRFLSVSDCLCEHEPQIGYTHGWKSDGDRILAEAMEEDLPYEI